MTLQPLFQSTLISKRPRVANFADIIIIETMLIKATFKDSKNLKELEVTYSNGIYICISGHNKSC